MKKLFSVLSFLVATIVSASAQVTLTGTSYTQNFNSISNGLPAGWSVRAGSSASSLGTNAVYNGPGISWGDSGGAFKNFAGPVSNAGVAYTGSETISVQGSTTNRTLGIRQTDAFGNPGAAFVFQLANTLNFENFQLSLDFNMLSVQGRSTIWKLQYGLGSNPTSFTQVGTDYVDPGAYGSTTKVFTFPAAIDNQNQNVWIRVVALTAATGSGSRDSFGIDNFNLTYSTYVPPSGPPIISSQPSDKTVWKGTNITFAVEASGLAPLSYQWFLNNNPVANGTSSALVLNPVTTAHAGTYRVEVTNTEGTDVSDSFVLTVQSPVVSTIAGLRDLVDTVNWVPPVSETLYEIEGFMTTRGNLTASGNLLFYLQDSTAGIAVFVSGGTLQPLQKDRIRVAGRLTHFNGLLQLFVENGNPTHKYLIFGPSTPLAPPIHLDYATMSDVAAMEALEGSLVVVSNSFIDLSSPNFSWDSTVKITNAFDLSKTFDLRIANGTMHFNGATRPVGSTTIIGVLSQHSLTDPRTNGYQLLPTSYWDEVLPGPKISSHPVGQNVMVGESVSLSVSALNLGVGALRYQWLKNGVIIPGATTSTYTINSAALGDTGYYSAWVRNDNAIAPSAPAYLGIGTGAMSVMHYNVKGNFSEDFSATGTQVQAIGRQLAHLQPDIITLNEIPIGKTHVVTNLVQDFLPGYFWATNSGTDGAIRSVILSRWRVLRSESWLDAAPLDSFGYSGNFTRDLFEAEVDVPGYVQPLHIFTTHLKSGSDLDECLKRAAEASAISNYFVNGFLTTNSGRSYILTGDLNEDINRPSANNQAAVQRIRNSATGLQLTTPLDPFTADDRTFSIQALPLDHRYDYILPSGSLTAQISTSQVFRTSVLAPLPPGLVANDDSTASDHLPVLVKFNNPSFVAPIFLSQPQDVVSAAGSPASFTVEVGSATSVTYRWKKGEEELANGGNISGADAATLNLASVSELDAGLYSVVVTNIYGVVTSEVATLTIAIPPTITSDPQNSTNIAGTTATFTVAASGTDSLSYQWKKNNSPLTNGGRVSGVDTATLVITGVTTGDNGNYSVTVTNIAGTVDSAAAELAVFTAPAITVNPTSRTVAESGTSVLGVTATGTGPLSYQWYFNSSAISSGTDSSYSIINAGAGDSGNYFVVVSNFAGSVASSTALVKVALAQTPLLPANLVVLRLGDSQQTLGNTGNSAYLDQFTTTGNYVSTLAIPDSGPDAVIFAGNATSEGALSRSANGIYLNFAGYNTARPAGSSVTASTASSLPRAVGQVNATGVYSVPVKTTTHYSGVSVRSAVSDGANNYWGAGGNSGTHYFGTDAAPATVQSSIANTRVVNVFNGKLYFSTGSGTTGLYRFEGTPTSLAAATLMIPSVGGTYGFAISPDETIVYIADEAVASAGGGIHRWDLVAGNWVKASYVLGTAGTTGARSVVADFSGADPVVYATTAETTGNRVVRVVDIGVGSVPVTLASAGANQVFRGIQFSPDAPAPAAIVAGPNGLDLLQGEAASFTVSATGTAPLRYQWLKDGSPIAGANSSVYNIPAVQPADVGSYSVTISNMVNSVTSSSVGLTVQADPVAPFLKVLNPKANLITSTSPINMLGTVLEGVRDVRVDYALNGAASEGTTVNPVGAGKPSNWNAWVNLKPGTNEIVITATDLAGNSMSVGPIKFYYHTPSPLLIVKTLNGNDAGTNQVGTVVNAISPALFSSNNTNLFVGRTYTLKALETGAPRYILTNWTATWTGQSTPVRLQTNNLVCTFEMKEGMTIRANFIDNPFYRFGGTYVGLFSDTNNGVALNSAGFAQLKVTPKMAFSAKVLVDGNAVALAGKLSIDGDGSAVSKSRFKVTGKPELAITLKMDFAGASDTITGTISQGSDWESSLTADRMVWSKTDINAQAGQFATNYTMQIPGFADLTDGPVGTASASIKIDRFGKIVIAGTGSDLHVIKQATWISADGRWPMFSPMYKVKRMNQSSKLITETRGFTMGWLEFTLNDSGNLRPEGELHTVKTHWENVLVTPGWTNALYANGFTNAVDVIASRWSYDATAPQNTLPDIDGVVVSFTDGDLGSGFNGTWDVTVKSTLTAIKGNTYANTVRAALVPKTGVIKGTFVHPTNSAITRYQGVFLQDYASGAGAFVGPTNSGKVTVSPTPAAE